MNPRNQTDVGYQTSEDEPKTKPVNTQQFPGKKMPQGNKMQKKTGKKVAKPEKKATKKILPKTKKEMSMVDADRIESYGRRTRRNV